MTTRRAHRRARIGAAFVAVCAVAQAQPGDAQRIEITGSAVRRIAAEGSLPVQTITRAQIEQSGATSLEELVQSLPAMHGFTNDAASVGGGGSGFAGASLHNLGEGRTLVLLNGRRLAPFAGQTITGAFAGVDLSTIPLAAVERVEILADGASALYGADAVAGVVNVVTRRHFADARVEAGLSAPAGGAQEQRVALAQGFGDFGADGHNVTVALGLQRRTALEASERRFARSSVIPLRYQGRDAVFLLPSVYATPANVITAGGDYVNPYLLAYGTCPPKHVDLGAYYGGAWCYYDTQADTQALPARERATLLAQGSVRLADGHHLFGEFLAAHTTTTSRITPVRAPALELGDDFVLYRLADAGRREQDDRTTARHAVLGLEGIAAGWDYVATLTHSQNRQATLLRRGHLRSTPVLDALLGGVIDPYVAAGQQSDAARQVLADAQITGFWEGGRTQLQAAQLRGSRDLGALGGGPLALAAGVGIARESYRKTASPLAQGVGDTRFLEDADIVPYRAERTLRALFAELVAPLSRAFEATASLRHDATSDFGAATTAKLSARWQPRRDWLLRASVGTGFKAPTLSQVQATRQLYGATLSYYDCTPELQAIASDLGAVCPPDGSQYNVYAQGNPGLKPEKSLQWTLGLRVEPLDALSIGADLWQVRVRRAIGQVSDATIFADPLAWRDLFTTYTDATGATYLALLLSNRNLGEQVQRGIDVDVRARARLPVGVWTSQLALTHHLKDAYQFMPGGAYHSSLGRFGPDGAVTFRWQGRWVNALAAGRWTHALAVNFRSGYRDQTYSADEGVVFDVATGEPIDYAGRVRSHVTFDWQSRWQVGRASALTLGVLNVADRAPPCSLLSAGGGFALGYDDRYYDPRGRTFYASVDLRF
nr:TonB-dependent receptor [Calidifontimicrobium sp. SYSU G02091]